MNASTFCVTIGKFAVSDESHVTMESFVGSSIALCLYDPHTKIACMAHVMYPDEKKEADNKRDHAKYANTAIENAVRSMTGKGAQVERILAKIAGGAEIFSHQEMQGVFNLGDRNIQAVKKLLTKNGIRLVSEDIGMNCSRHVKFSVKSGEVTSIQNNGKLVTL